MSPRLARRLVVGAVAGGVAADVLFDRVALGINVPIAVVALLFAATNLRPAGARFDRLDAWLPFVTVAAAVLVALRNDPIVTVLDLGLAGIGTVASMVALSGVAVTRQTLIAVTALGVLAGAWLALGAARLLGTARSDGGLPQAGTLTRRSAPIARGLLIALPVVIVFAALLASADAVFARVVNATLSLPLDLSDLATRAVVSLVFAWGIAGALAIATRAVPLEIDDAGVQELIALGRTAPERALAATEATVVLVLVDALFAVFVVLQVAYLFGGADTITAAGVTYSDYARAGYFQLVAVVVCAGVLLTVASFAARSEGGRPRGFVVAALGLLGLTAVILASAAVRLDLYQQAYGWTELRFYVAASIAWLGICGIVATALLLRDRMGWLVHGLAMGAVAVTLAVSVLGPQAFITQQNLARVFDPSLVAPGGHTGLDAEYLVGLGDDAIPQLNAALPGLDPASQLVLGPALHDRFVALVLNRADADWQAWNLSRENARFVLAHP